MARIVVYDSPEALLSAFIDSEEQALLDQVQGDVFPLVHYSIKKLLPKAHRYLSREDVVRCYCHWLRVTTSIPLLPDGEFPCLIEAYERFLTLDEYVSEYERSYYLFCFGYGRDVSLTSGKTTNMAQVKDYRKVMEHPFKYTSLPGQRAKVQGFKQFTPYAERIYEILPFCRNDMLAYWGLLLIVLLSPSTQNRMLDDFFNGKWVLGADEYSRLQQTVEAILPFCESDEHRFADLLSRLA